MLPAQLLSKNDTNETRATQNVRFLRDASQTNRPRLHASSKMTSVQPRAFQKETIIETRSTYSSESDASRTIRPPLLARSLSSLASRVVSLVVTFVRIALASSLLHSEIDHADAKLTERTWALADIASWKRY